MSGLETLMHEGLDITATDGWPPLGDGRAGGSAELLEWHSVAGGHLPDADLTVLLWLQYEDGTADWCSGWWDGEKWLDCASGDRVGGVVTHWAEPEGPAAWIGHYATQTGRQFAAMGDEPRSEACGPWIPLVTMAQAAELVAAERRRLREFVEAVRDANAAAQGEDAFRLLMPRQEQAWAALLAALA